MGHTRLLVAPVLGLLLFANVTYRSCHEYSQTRSTCYWWGNFVALDSKPRIKSVAFEGQKPVTECGFQEQAFDRFGLRFDVRLLAMTAFPAFLASMALADGFGALGLNEMPFFLLVTPVFIFAWYYLLGCAFERWRGRRRRRKAGVAVHNRT
jgi:hypothetical protein